MDKIFEVIRASRKALLTLVEDLTTEQLNKIPTGFSNNLAWQMGHLVVSQQVLCYKLSNNELVIDPTLVDKYRNGSKPESFISAEEIVQIKAYLLDTIDQLEKDVAANKFDNYTPYTISTYKGYRLEKIEDAIKFIVSHDGLHYGCSLMMKKFI
ncbi:MAG: DinB family protein [Pedobacter sp.]|uniref:DinB family protein n=1 Tax=Pedobacter sp. TaxID=1411316 RepID=UPI002809308F|nr:DinB family protein [Pedobacter sp.]MDQ8004039.1 DinB family protein [Pedobacter sp.]